MKAWATCVGIMLLPLIMAPQGSGQVAAASRESADPVVRLPPLLVQADAQTRWLHGEFAGTEILSSCDWDTTKRFAQRYLRAKEEFHQLVPEEFRLNPPELVILVPSKEAQLIAVETGRLMQAVSASSGAIPHLRVSSGDLSASFFIVDSHVESTKPAERGSNEAPEYLRFTLSPDYISYHLSSRRPALLPCIISGLTDSFESAAETGNGLCSRPDVWLTNADWRASRADVDAPRPLLPLKELLRLEPLQGDVRKSRLWRAQSQLFVRWSLFDTSSRSAGFWRFVRESAQRPFDERLFESCFGQNYSDCRDALSDFLPTAARYPTIWNQPVPQAHSLFFTSAKPEEIDWCKTEWDRLILTAVERDFPALLPDYRREALTMATRAAIRNERSLRILGSLGLIQALAGDEAAAMRTLEQAARAGSKRSPVLVELARLRLKHYLATKSVSSAELSEQETADVLALLNQAVQSSPSIEAGYLLYRAVLQHTKRPPTPTELAVMKQAAELFGESGN
jgi:hypothetical protein